MPPIGQSSVYPVWKLCTHPHTWQRPLLWGPHCCQGGEDKVNWEPRPTSKHQVVWTVPGNCRSGGIIGMCYFSQMRWPVGFLYSPSFPIMHIIVWCDLSTSRLVWRWEGVVCSHLMPRILHSFSIMLLVKLAPLLLKSLARAPKIEITSI